MTGFRRGAAILASAVAMTMTLVAGCAAPAAPASAGPEDILLDPCADRLHELSGQLLLFYSVRHHLPEGLSQLPPTTLGLLECPGAGDAYVYLPGGLEYPGLKGAIILFDRSPSHDGKRYAVLATPGASCPTLRVVRLADDPVFSAVAQPQVDAEPK